LVTAKALQPKAAERSAIIGFAGLAQRPCATPTPAQGLFPADAMA
jgi:hypothetical protein